MAQGIGDYATTATQARRLRTGIVIADAGVDLPTDRRVTPRLGQVHDDLLPRTSMILVSLGYQDKQDPTAPMGDYMLTEALAVRVAERANAIATPTLPFGYAG